MLETLSEELKNTRAFEVEMRRFADMVVSDIQLQQQLADAVDNGASKDDFRDLYVSSAAKHDIHFTGAQMEIAMQEQKQGKDKVLPTAVQKLITIL